MKREAHMGQEHNTTEEKENTQRQDLKMSKLSFSTSKLKATNEKNRKTLLF
jgi:hypothetical protein